MHERGIVSRLPACALLLASVLPTTAASPPPSPAPEWVAAWTSAQVGAGSKDLLEAPPAGSNTLRQIVHLTAGGTRIRIRLSNVFGRTPLTIAQASVALAAAPGSDRILADTLHTVTFAGKSQVAIAPGAEIWSDPVSQPVSAFSSLSVSFHLPRSADPATGHGDARATAFMAPGDQTGRTTLQGAQTTGHWYQLSAVAVGGGSSAGTVIAIGDSITDSYMSPVDGNARWPDVLATRLHASGSSLAVVNQGLGGNRILNDVVGPRLLYRLERDVFATPGARCVILLQGVNDLGSLTRQGAVSPQRHKALISELIDAYRLIVAGAHRQGLRVIGGTIMPYAGSGYYRPDAVNEADRQALNAWIRSAQEFDGVIDFDAVTRDPAHPDRLLPEYDSGDHIHPSPAGYVAMGQAVPLDLVRRECTQSAGPR